MFALSNLLIAVAHIVNFILTIMYWLVMARAVLSWVSPDPDNPIVQFLYRMTEPLLRPVRENLPIMGMDISPIVVFMAIMFLKTFLVRTIIDIASRVG